MADAPTPTPPAPIQGFRSRAINAAVDYTTAVRPLAGAGIMITDGAGGKTISVQGMALADRAVPWLVQVYPKSVNGSATAVAWKVRVYAGLAVLNGARLSPPTPAGTDATTGLQWFEAPDNLGLSYPWLCVVGGTSGWSLAWKANAISTAPGTEYRAIAHLESAGPPVRISQVELGVVDLGGDDGGGGGGGTEVAKILGGSDYTANTDTWEYGDLIDGSPCYPVFKPFRIYWDSQSSTLYWFYRTLTFNAHGQLQSVSEETQAYATISGGGTTGFSGQRTVVTDVSWDEDYHRFRQTKETWNYTNGLLQPSVSSATTTIVTAVPEMP